MNLYSVSLVFFEIKGDKWENSHTHASVKQITMRQSGYYWIRDEYEWYVGYFESTTGMWTVTGNDEEYHETDFLEIDETQITRQ